MSRRFFSVIIVGITIVLLAGAVSAVPPDELETPVFTSCPDYSFSNISTCQEFVSFTFEAKIPNQPNARGRLRYHLVSGPGELDEKSGNWIRYPQPEDTRRMYKVEIAASIFNTDLETSDSGNCIFWLRYRNTPPRLQPIFEVFGHGPSMVARIPAPVDTLLAFKIHEPDSCETPRLTIESIDPAPAGLISLVEDTVLWVQLTASDQGGKFVVNLLLTSGSDTIQIPVVIETRDRVVPRFTECPAGTLMVPLCGELKDTITAVDPDYPDSRTGITYSLKRDSLSRPPAFINHQTGEFYFRPRPTDAGRVLAQEVIADYAGWRTDSDRNCRFWIQVAENQPPEFVDSPCSTLTVSLPTGSYTFNKTLHAIDPDSCQRPPNIYIADVAPTPTLPWRFDPRSGQFSMETTPEEEGVQFDVTAIAIDGIDTSVCIFSFLHEKREVTKIEVERTRNTYQGARESIDVTVSENDVHFYGFDMLLSYDARILTFQQALPGSIIDTCDWEYFTYRYGPASGCEPNCPSGLVRVVGIAETNNGDFHPSCHTTDLPFTLFTLEFLVTNDRTYEGGWVPIQFSWIDCGDNSVSFQDQIAIPYQFKVGVSNRVLVYDSTGAFPREVTKLSGTFPNNTGAPDICFEGTDPGREPVRLIDFYSGGLDVYSSGDIDDRGDVNLNGIPFEVADLMLFSNYLVYGKDLLDPAAYSHQLRNTDVTRDGAEATIEDLVYMLRVIIGDGRPYPPDPDTATAYFSFDGNIVSLDSIDSDTLLGAVYCEVNGQVQPTLEVQGFTLRSTYHADTALTRILMISDDGNAISPGPLFSYDQPGSPVLFETATFDGLPVKVTLRIPTDAPDNDDPTLPIEFALYQNHPNPFNLETIIPFDLPRDTDITIEIFNVLGQLVYEQTNYYTAGRHNARWNGTNNDGQVAVSGIYYYRITADGYTASKKMVLLK